MPPDADQERRPNPAAKTMNKKNKKKKKPRKDKWGQTLPAADDGEAAAAGEDWAEPRLPPEFEPRKIVVSGMPYSTTEDQIRRLFEKVGAISLLQLSAFPDSGNFRGLAFVTFQTEELAEKCLELDGIDVNGRFIKVERCRLNPRGKRKSEFCDEPQKVEGCLSAYVGNLSWNTREDDIVEFFNTSKITSIRFAQDKRTGAFRGFGHIEFADDKSLEEAIKKNQLELRGRPLKISYAITNKR